MSDPFDAAAADFLRYLASPHGRLRAALLQDRVRAGLRRDPPVGPERRALDVGAGDCALAACLAAEGWAVTVAEPSRALAARAPASLRVIRAPLAGLARALDGARFDLVICHNVLEYLPAPVASLGRLRALAAPGARLSLATLGAAQEPLRRAIRDRDLEGALEALRRGGPLPSLYGVGRRPTDPASLSADAAAAGWRPGPVTGVFAVADYLTPDRLDDDAGFAQARALEQAAGERPALAAVSRYLHLWAAQTEASAPS